MNSWVKTELVINQLLNQIRQSLLFNISIATGNAEYTSCLPIVGEEEENEEIEE